MDNRQAFEVLYREQAVQVCRYLLSIGCPAQDVEDVIQETFVKALLHSSSFRGDSKLSVWLCRIAQNTWYDLLKKQRRQLPLTEAEQHAWDDHWPEWIDVVERLPEPYRSVFVRRAMEGWSYGELAQAYGKTEGWARVTFHRARLRLKFMLEEWEVQE